MRAARLRERIELCLTPGFVDAPLGLDQALVLESMERGVERALLDLKHVPGDCLDALGDRPAVSRLGGDGLEDQHVERALNEVRWSHTKMIYNDRMIIYNGTAGVKRKNSSLCRPLARCKIEPMGPRERAVRRLLLVCAAMLLSGDAAAAQKTVIRAGRLLDVTTGNVLRDQFIVIENGRIRSVGPLVATPAGDSIVDLSVYTVLPGLIDAHVHLAIGGAVRQNAAAILAAGFTTVVDLGARTTRLLSLRDSINAGHIPGPRVLAAGIWIGRKDGVCEFGGIGIADGAEGFRERVRVNVQAGADVIKACVSGWPAEAYAQPDRYELPDSVLAALVDESRRLGRKVIAHAISLGGVQAALRAGVHGLAHAAYLDSATAVMMRTRGMFLIPTLASLTADTSPASRVLIESTRLAHRAGVQFVFGTDGGVLPHGENAKEFSALALAGVSSLDAIRSATINAAKAFGLADSLGTLAPGMIADIIAVNGDPLSDVTALQRVRFLMSRGRVVSMRD